MRRVFILVLLCAISSTAFTQGIFGASHKEVRDTLTKYGLIYVTSANATDGTIYDSYKDRDGDQTICYFNKNGDCYQERQFYDKKTLIDKIEYLNNKFIKVDAKSWINKNTSVKIYLNIPDEPSADFYYISFISIVVKSD